MYKLNFDKVYNSRKSKFLKKYIRLKVNHVGLYESYLEKNTSKKNYNANVEYAISFLQSFGFVVEKAYKIASPLLN